MPAPGHALGRPGDAARGVEHLVGDGLAVGLQEAPVQLARELGPDLVAPGIVDVDHGGDHVEALGELELAQIGLHQIDTVGELILVHQRAGGREIDHVHADHPLGAGAGGEHRQQTGAAAGVEHPMAGTHHAFERGLETD